MALEHEPDVLTITEHWKCEEDIKNYQIDGYRLASFYRRQRRSHGGCALYISNKCSFTDNGYIKSLSVPKVVECCAAQIKMKIMKVVVICIYVPNTPPECNVYVFLETLRSMLDWCIINNEKFIITGDFNINVLADNRECRDLVSLLEMYNRADRGEDNSPPY
ncbi:hypothetical protein WA026_017414 [Henosepilachna vigintioctopunctata]|uniref:Endonuclease/exonuclease/phosphatase domain-containing protein n=1 Tax=Henosepilachna vigintioctopunctata TaxID=420089 RepID=A0AAW1VGW5_9CUCU